MAAKTYFVRFSTGNPTTYTGLSPTFILFTVVAGVTTPPGITEVPTSTGIYYFNYDALGPLAFVIDGATTSLVTADRFIAGSLDPLDQLNFLGQTLTAIGMSNIALGVTSVAIGTTLVGFGVTNAAVGTTLSARIGTAADVIGDSSTDPISVYGFLMRAQNYAEGRSVYTKASGVWAVTDKTGATTLASRTITDSATAVTKA